MKRLSSIRRIPGVALLLVAAALSAQDLVPYADQSVVSKEAWLWNDDERIAARFDPVKIRERAPPTRHDHSDALAFRQVWQSVLAKR